MRPNLTLELRQYNKSYRYVQYVLTDEEKKKNIVFNNAEYVKFDVTSERYAELTKNSGGFYANMTTRHTKELEERDGCRITAILLFCGMQNNNEFVFSFVYLDENSTVRDHMEDNNYFDYEFFKNRLKDAICEQGMIYGLMSDEPMEPLTDMVCPNPSLDFGIQVDGKEITYDDTLRYDGTDIFKPAFRETLRKLDASHVELRLDCDYLKFIHMTGRIKDSENKFLKRYQIKSGIKDIDEYLRHMEELHPNYAMDEDETEDFEFDISLRTARSMTSKMTRI